MDVAVYPRTIKPVAQRTSFAIEVVFDTFTPRGDIGVWTARTRLTELAAGLIGAGWNIAWSPPAPRTLAPGHVRHVMTWTVPSTWLLALALVGSAWRSFLESNIIAVDDFYTDAITEPFEAIPHGQDVDEIALQSCVATDSLATGMDRHLPAMPAHSLPVSHAPVGSRPQRASCYGTCTWQGLIPSRSPATSRWPYDLRPSAA